MEELLKQAQERGNEDFTISPEESEQLKRAFDDPEFRRMFGEYLEDMQSPQFRQESEQYLRELEAQQQIPEGKKLIRPTGKFVVKGRRVLRGKREKIFVNIVEHESIATPKAERKGDGQQWSVPYSLGPVRMEKDKSEANVPTYDCCFHPDALRYAQNSKAFRELLIKVALDGVKDAAKRQDQEVEIESEFHILKNVVYKSGEVVSMMLSTEDKSAAPAAAPEKATPAKREAAAPARAKLTAKKETSRSSTTTSPAKTPSQAADAKEAAQLRPISTTAPVRSEKTPEYKIVERGKIDIGGQMEGPVPELKSTRPNELVIVFELPKVERAAGLDLDVAERTVKLVYKDIYDASIALPYPVHSDQGSAKFDKAKKTLTVTIPVQAAVAEPLQRHDTISPSHDEDEENEPGSSNATEADKRDRGALAAPAVAQTVDHSRWVEQADGPTEVDPAIDAAKAAAAANPTLPRPPKAETKPVPEKVTEDTSPLEIHRAPFEFRQNQRTVAVLIQVKGIRKDTVDVQYSGRKVDISFLGLSPADAESYRQLCAYWQSLELAGDINEQECKVDVADNNMLLALTKATQGFWGITPDSTLPPASTSAAPMGGVVAEAADEPSSTVKDRLRAQLAGKAVSASLASTPAVTATAPPPKEQAAKKPAVKASAKPADKPTQKDVQKARPKQTPKSMGAAAAVKQAPAAPSLKLKTDLLFELD